MFSETNLYKNISIASTGLTQGSYANRSQAFARMERLLKSIRNEDICTLLHQHCSINSKTY